MLAWVKQVVVIVLALGAPLMAWSGEPAPFRIAATEFSSASLRFSGDRVGLLAAGHDALVARLDLIMNARDHINLQYYIYQNDRSGRLIARALLQAADSGVKVRILLDAIHGEDDDMMEALNQHPNIEARRFNPFRWRQMRLLESVLAFSRVNRRMHNKQITADGGRAIVGGRNIGDAYFGTGETSYFADLDVLVEGNTVKELEVVFDEYWRHHRSKPVHRFTSSGHKKLDALRRSFVAQQQEDDAAMRPLLQRSNYVEMRERGAALPYQCPVAVMADKPEFKEDEESKSEVADGLSYYLNETEKEILLISAYFVPGKEGMKALRQARERQVNIQVLTNSLASTDVPAVHGGYSYYRKTLLQEGVQLWEMKPEAGPRERQHFSLRSNAQASLHTKAYVFDERYLFIGSFNMDPRSAVLNTEMGLMFDCPVLVRDFMEGVSVLMPEMAWKVGISDKGKLLWRDANQLTHEGKEPQAGFWRRSKVWWLQRLPMEGSL